MIYLDNAATTFPKPQCMVDEIKKCINNYCGNPGRSSHKLSIKSAEKIFDTRVLLADLFSAEPENVVFTLNTTYALNLAIKSLLKPNSHVLISNIEHNSVYRPIYKLSSENLCSFDIFDSSGTKEDILKSINSLLKSNTSMLICSHVSNIGVRRLPIKEIGELCKRNNIVFIVDAAQSAGIYEINIKDMNINALCFPAHKGLYGPQGVGAVIFNNCEPIRSIIEGGTGINSKDTFMPDFLPEVLEAGTLPTPAIAGWYESLKWLKKISIEKIRNHEEDLYVVCKNMLETNEKIKLYTMNNYSGNTILFNIKNKTPSTISSLLDKYDICVRSGFHCSPLAHKLLNTNESGAIRISFSVFNTRNEIYEFYDRLKSLIRKKEILI